MKEIIKYKGKRWIEYRKPFFRSIDFALLFGLIIGAFLNFSGWYSLVSFLIVFLTYLFVSWLYEKELVRVTWYI